MFDIKNSVLLSGQESNPEEPNFALLWSVSHPSFLTYIRPSLWNTPLHLPFPLNHQSPSLERLTNSRTSNRLNGFPWSADLLPAEFNPVFVCLPPWHWQLCCFSGLNSFCKCYIMKWPSQKTAHPKTAAWFAILLCVQDMKHKSISKPFVFLLLEMKKIQRTGKSHKARQIKTLLLGSLVDSLSNLLLWVIGLFVRPFSW